MEPGTSSSRNPMADGSAQSNSVPLAGTAQTDRGVRTRGLLILAMAIITTGTTFVSLLAIRRPLQKLIVENVSSDLLHSVATFENVRSQRVMQLDRENALMADLPSLKALMTTSDERTIADGAVEFWNVSGNELFALADRNGQIMAAFVSGGVADATLRANLHNFLAGQQGAYFVSGNSLFGCSVQPLYFGSSSQGTLLGYVVSGFAIDHAAVEKLSRATNVDAAFMSGGRLLASSLAPRYEQNLSSVTSRLAPGHSGTFTLLLGGEEFLAVSRDLAGTGPAPITLIEMKSLDQEERAIREIDRLVLLAGLLALLLGSVLMIVLSRFVTRPLEQLAAGVRAFASGDSAHLLPYRGTREVRELSAAFGGMRREIVNANQALLESERLATIGRMASSVSHDLRHYLAAVYANSEFLASGKLPESERNEILAEIRTAVNGTTELLESLLMFSRTGSAARRSQNSITAMVEKAVSLVRAHPDAAGVTLSVDAGDPAETEIVADAKQIERAIYNLLLNGCQSPHTSGIAPEVSITVTALEDVQIDVRDNGDGIPAGVRDTLFEPFVSEGKHKGSGLGLTLTQSIAVDHGGGVVLVSSVPGETVFRMTMARGTVQPPSAIAGHARMGER
jgi:signal transduction histidine kinase